MRINSGIYKGQTLFQPPLSITRPTTDKIRQAVFNIIENNFCLNYDNLYVLDAFAGSGAMGFEALSRGAHYLVSIDQSPEAYLVLKANQKKLKIPDVKIKILQKNVLFSFFDDIIFDLVFLDPPYKENSLYQKTIDHLIMKKIVKKETLFCIETLKNIDLHLKGNILFERVYGQSKIIFLNHDL
jgi:16S rRNA (guanine966-N2)-methyltransferase